MDMLKILVADDHPKVRKNLVELIREGLLNPVISEASDGLQAREMLNKNTFDVVILDISMPHLTGIEVTRQMRSLQNNTPVILLSMHDEKDYGKFALNAGANNYIDKGKIADSLLEAIRRLTDK